MKKTKISYGLAFLFIILWFVLSIIGTIFTGNIIVSTVIGFALPILTTAAVQIGTDLIKKVIKIEEAEEEKKKEEQEHNCRIVVFGMPGSGKTTLIRKLLTHGLPRQEKSTKKFTFHKHKILLDLEDPYPVAFADYKGQAMGDIVTDAPEDFFGEKDARIINAIFFIVDLFPEIPDENENPEKFQETLKEYKEEALVKIDNWVRENQEYVNKNTIEPVIRVCRSDRTGKQLFAVRFVINKIDFFERIISEYGSYKNKVNSPIEYAKNLYANQIQALEIACKKNRIKDFSVRVISAKYGDKYGDDMTGLLIEIALKHKERSKYGKATSKHS